jgi:hypothetical protein
LLTSIRVRDYLFSVMGSIAIEPEGERKPCKGRKRFIPYVK